MEQIGQVGREELARIGQRVQELLVDDVAGAVGTDACVFVAAEERLQLGRLLARQLDAVIEETGDAASERLDCDDERAQVDELGRGGQRWIEGIRVEHQRLQRPAGVPTPQKVLVRVEMSVDKSRYRQTPAGFDDLDPINGEV